MDQESACESERQVHIYQLAINRTRPLIYDTPPLENLKPFSRGKEHRRRHHNMESANLASALSRCRSVADSREWSVHVNMRQKIQEI